MAGGKAFGPEDDTALTAEDVAVSNLILWGDPGSNAALAKILSRLPLQWSRDKLTLAGQTYDAAQHAPILIYPNPANPSRYLVLNSGVTFRENALLTNAQQTPKLPDWAVIDLRTPPDTKRPGLVLDAGFFDEAWQWLKRLIAAPLDKGGVILRNRTRGRDFSSGMNLPKARHPERSRGTSAVRSRAAFTRTAGVL